MEKVVEEEGKGTLTETHALPGMHPSKISSIIIHYIGDGLSNPGSLGQLVLWQQDRGPTTLQYVVLVNYVT